MDVKKVTCCPLGSKCQEIKDNALHECAWYIQIMGVNPNTGEETNDKGCAMAWLPVLLVENSRQQRGTGAAIESFRNEMVRANEVSQNILLATTQNNPLLKGTP